jgi:hypothetical protein
MDMYILTKSHMIKWHVYVLIDQFDYSGLFY